MTNDAGADHGHWRFRRIGLSKEREASMRYISCGCFMCSINIYKAFFFFFAKGHTDAFFLFSTFVAVSNERPASKLFDAGVLAWRPRGGSVTILMQAAGRFFVVVHDGIWRARGKMRPYLHARTVVSFMLELFRFFFVFVESRYRKNARRVVSLIEIEAFFSNCRPGPRSTMCSSSKEARGERGYKL